MINVNAIYSLNLIKNTAMAEPVPTGDANAIPEIGFGESNSAVSWDGLSRGMKNLAAWTKSIWNSNAGGAVGCGYISGEYLDKARRGDGGVGPDASDGGPDASDGGDSGVCIDNNPPGNFGTTSPANNATNVSLRPTFEWANSVDPDGDPVTYSLLIDTNQDFSSAVTYDASGMTSYTLSDPLATETNYYWRVIAKDTCDAETESIPFVPYSFTTLADCSTPPAAFSLVSPGDGDDWVSLTPTLDWADAIDADPGDSATYRLEIATNGQFTSPVVYDNLTQSNFTIPAGDALANNQIYYWRVTATDDCDNEVAASQIFYFTTEPACIPQTIVETDFVTGDGTDVMVGNGSVELDHAWTHRWDAASGLLPTEANPAWTLEAPNGGAATLTTDPVSGEPALHVNSIGADNYFRYVINPGFSNATGWVVEWRARVVTTETTEQTCSVEVTDGTKRVRPSMGMANIFEPFSNSNYAMDTTNGMHVYRLKGQSDNYELFIDNISVLNFSNGGNFPENMIRFPDNIVAADSESYWGYFYYYNAGPSVPYLSPGEHVSAPYDLGSSPNNLGSGATLVFNGTTLPSTNIVLQTRSGSTAVPDGSWSGWQGLSGGQIQSPTARYLQIRSNLSTTDTSITPRLDDFAIDYCNY